MKRAQSMWQVPLETECTTYDGGGVAAELRGLVGRDSRRTEEDEGTGELS